MVKKPEITPEQIEAGVKKNVNEYSARVAALRALHEEKAYNPAVDPALLSKAAVEAQRGAAGPGPAMKLSRNNEGDVRLSARDPEAEALAKGARHGRQAKNEESESGEDGQGDARVQARQATFGQQARPQGAFAQAGNSDRAVGVWTEATWEAESEEAVRAMVPAGAKAVEVFQVWKATALVRQ